LDADAVDGFLDDDVLLVVDDDVSEGREAAVDAVRGRTTERAVEGCERRDVDDAPDNDGRAERAELIAGERVDGPAV